jgi:UDP-2-acetamido-3-amino-2,3-dideoxy-glucuronate N-acetyltransferase
MTPAFIDPSAEVSVAAVVGEGSYIWNWTKVRELARIGSGTSIGQHCYIDRGVVIGERCKIQNSVNIYDGVTIGEEVFVGPSVTFTNDLHPSAVGEWLVVPTFVERGVSIGANSTIVCGVTIGEYSVVGAGSVVVNNVPAATLVVGSPARIVRQLKNKNDLNQRGEL